MFVKELDSEKTDKITIFARIYKDKTADFIIANKIFFNDISIPELISNDIVSEFFNLFPIGKKKSTYIQVWTNLKVRKNTGPWVYVYKWSFA